MFCIVDGLEFATRRDFVEWLIEFCEDNDRTSENTRNILPTCSLHKNCEHHPVRIAREIGFNVVVVEV